MNTVKSHFYHFYFTFLITYFLFLFQDFINLPRITEGLKKGCALQALKCFI